METALPYGGGTVELKFLLLPEEDDPDTFVRARVRMLSGRWRPRRCRCRISSLKSCRRRSTLGAWAAERRFEPFAKPLLKRFPGGTYRSAIMHAFGEELNLDPAVFDANHDRSPPPIRRASDAQSGGARAQDGRPKGHQRSLSTIRRPPRRQRSVSDLAGLNQPGADVLRRVFGTAPGSGDANAARLLENMRDDPDIAAPRADRRPSP